MSVLDVFRQEYVNGKVVDKYRLENGNLGLIVEGAATRRRYHVEFRDNYKGPSTIMLRVLEPISINNHLTCRYRCQSRISPPKLRKPTHFSELHPLGT